VSISWQTLTLLALLLSAFSFLLMGFDKNRARHKAWRISERTLWVFAILGGALGTWIGMRIFRHKTQKPIFKMGVPCLVIVQWAYLAACFAGLM